MVLTGDDDHGTGPEAVTIPQVRRNMLVRYCTPRQRQSLLPVTDTPSWTQPALVIIDEPLTERGAPSMKEKDQVGSWAPTDAKVEATVPRTAAPVIAATAAATTLDLGVRVRLQAHEMAGTLSSEPQRPVPAVARTETKQNKDVIMVDKQTTRAGVDRSRSVDEAVSANGSATGAQEPVCVAPVPQVGTEQRTLPVRDYPQHSGIDDLKKRSHSSRIDEVGTVQVGANHVAGCRIGGSQAEKNQVGASQVDADAKLEGAKLEQPMPGPEPQAPSPSIVMVEQATAGPEQVSASKP